MTLTPGERRRAAAAGSVSPPSGPSLPDGGGFDPSGHTVPDVLAYLEAHPDERTTLYAAELDGKARVTLLDALDPDTADEE